MTAAFKQKGRHIRTVKVPLETGGWKNRTTGTRDPVTARQMQAMIRELGPQGKHAWDLLAPLIEKKTTVAELWRRWCAVPRPEGRNGKRRDPSTEERIEHLRAERQAVNLVPLVDDWFDVLTGSSEQIALDTAQHYRASARRFIAWHLGLESWTAVETAIWDAEAAGKPGPVVLASVLTPERLREWIEEMDDVEPGTVRKIGQGMRRFTTWLRGRGKIAGDPMGEVRLPAQGKPRDHHIDTHEAKALADAQPGQYRPFAALLAGSGIEVSVALELRRRDVDEQHREIRAAGTKTHNRDRIARVAEWAWPYVTELLKGRHPDAKLFDEIPHRWAAREVHADAVRALAARFPVLLEQGGYTMRDHRHTWAVRAARSGWPIEAIARQLGHVNGVLALKVYGRFVPTHQERERWEQLAATRDRELEAQRRAQEGGR